MDLTRIEEKIRQLSQMTKKSENCESLLKYINDNWNNIQEEKDRQNQRYKLAKLTNKKKKARRSYGEYENSLCSSVIEICGWKTNRQYMELASSIIFDCGFSSYTKDSNRLKQKIENIKKCQKKKGYSQTR